MPDPTVGSVVHSFFEDYLKLQRGLRPASVKSYRDALKMFLLFVADDSRHKITQLSLQDLTFDRVLRFLKHLEEVRDNRIATRNHRLAALRGFFEYLGRRVPESLVEAERIETIPTKRVSPPRTRFLERDEIQTVFAGLPRQGPLALRDRSLLLFLYNTGARAQEVAELRVENLRLNPPPSVQLHGKGDKWRSCPLWAETASALEQLLHQQIDSPNQPVFSSRRGRPLTRFGIYKVVRRHTHQLMSQQADARRRWISPHVFRHTTAVHLLEAGVEVNVIRAWLGHVSLDTTNRYAEINTHTKQAALQVCEPPSEASQGFPRRPVWRDDERLLNWLDSL
jgi:integrase/recombinase XerD